MPRGVRGNISSQGFIELVGATTIETWLSKKTEKKKPDESRRVLCLLIFFYDSLISPHFISRRSFKVLSTSKCNHWFKLSKSVNHFLVSAITFFYGQSPLFLTPHFISRRSLKPLRTNKSRKILLYLSWPLHHAQTTRL